MPTPIYPGDYAPSEGNPAQGSKGLPSGEMIASEIRRREQMLLNFMGDLCTIYNIKKDGPQCSCYRHYQRQSIDPDCPVCFGVGFINGYEQLTTDRFVELMTRAEVDPTGSQTIVTPNYKYLDQLTEREISTGKFLVRFPPSDNSALSDKLRLYDSFDTRAWTTLSLLLEPRDIIIRSDGTRYRVKSSRVNRSMRGLFTHQKLVVQLVDRADSVYRIGSTPIVFESDPIQEMRAEPASVRAYGGLYYFEQYFNLFDYSVDYT